MLVPKYCSCSGMLRCQHVLVLSVHHVAGTLLFSRLCSTATLGAGHALLFSDTTVVLKGIKVGSTRNRIRPAWSAIAAGHSDSRSPPTARALQCRAGSSHCQSSHSRHGCRPATTVIGVSPCGECQGAEVSVPQCAAPACSRSQGATAAGTIMSYALNSNSTDTLQRQADFNHFSIHDPMGIQVCHDYPVRAAPAAWSLAHLPARHLAFVGSGRTWLR